jgi:hypothetical protein
VSSAISIAAIFFDPRLLVLDNDFEETLRRDLLWGDNIFEILFS